jgi:predicted transcriptional regulator
MSDQATLLAEIDAFLAPRRMAPSTFGRLAVNDGKFVRRLRAGADFRTQTMARVRAFIRQYKAAEAIEAARLADLVASDKIAA